MSEPSYSLSLLEDDGDVVAVGNDVLKDGCKDVEHSLVAKVLTDGKINREVFKGVMVQVWGVVGKMEVKVVGDNTFLFIFRNKVDKNRVWSRGPWHFDRCFIAMEKPVGMGDISRLSFNKMEIWVQIHNIPLGFMNRRMEKFLADQIGKAIEIPLETKDCRGRFLCVNITLPLKRGLKVQREGTDELVVLRLEYERLPNFCFVCGCVDHVSGDCEKDEANMELLSEVGARFGSWMRATSEWGAVVGQNNSPDESSRGVSLGARLSRGEKDYGKGREPKGRGIEGGEVRGVDSLHMESNGGIENGLQQGLERQSGAMEGGKQGQKCEKLRGREPVLVVSVVGGGDKVGNVGCCVVKERRGREHGGGEK